MLTKDIKKNKKLVINVRPDAEEELRVFQLNNWDLKMRKRNPNFKIPSSDTPQDSLSALKLGVIVGLYETYPKFKNYNQKYIFERLDYI